LGDRRPSLQFAMHGCRDYLEVSGGALGARTDPHYNQQPLDQNPGFVGQFVLLLLRGACLSLCLVGVRRDCAGGSDLYRYIFIGPMKP